MQMTNDIFRYSLKLSTHAINNYLRRSEKLLLCTSELEP